MAESKVAKVYIANHLGKDITNVTLEHIYSSRAPETLTIGAIDKAETSPKYIGLVNFETGFGTGLDWWKLTWTDSNSKLYTSDKSFLSKLGTYFAKYVSDILAVASSSINVWSLVTNKQKWISSVVNLAVVVYNFGTRDTVSTMDRLKDYKEFMLEKDDDQICFSINEGHTISIIANSCETSSFEYFEQQVLPEPLIDQIDLNTAAQTPATEV